MNYFNGRFDITDGGYHDESHYKIVGTVIDNSGTYFASDAKVGDIIYADGTGTGVTLLRYKITEVLPETSGADLSVLVKWDMIEGIDAQEPFGGMEAIIGSIHKNNLTANITPQSYNSANELLIANANSYQNMLLGNADLSEINKKVSLLEEKIEAVRLEWEESLLFTE